MTARDVVRRLEAYSAGAPLERGATVPLRFADTQDLLALAFVRMGGESLPWAVGVASQGGKKDVFAIPDARDRDRVGEMLVRLTPRVAAHFDHPQWSDGTVSSEDPVKEIPFRQIWLPNGSHVQMLHMLNLRYTFARAGDPTRAATLRALGRLGGFLFREAARPGQVTVIDASAALREVFTFPVDDLRQQHLGLLLTMLEPAEDDVERRLKAEAAERLTVSLSLDPEHERTKLAPFVDTYTTARRGENKAKMRAAEQEIAQILEGEIRRRLDLTLAAVKRLRDDRRPVNAGAVQLSYESNDARQQDFLRLEERIAEDGEEKRFPPSPETDRNPRTGASRYHKLSSADQEVAAILIHDDLELQQDAIAAGDALKGTIVKIENRPVPDSRAVDPVWTLEAPSAGPTRLRKGSKVCVAGMPQRSGAILSLELDGDKRRLQIQIDNWKRKPNPKKYPQFADALAAGDEGYEQTEVTLLAAPLNGIGIRKSTRVWGDTGPGAWLTHGVGRAPRRRRRGANAQKLLAEVEKVRR